MATREQRIKWIAKEFIDSEISFFDFATHNGNIQICAVDNKWMLKVVENNLDPLSPRVIEREVTYKSLEQLLNTLCNYEVTALSDSLGFIETPEKNKLREFLYHIVSTKPLVNPDVSEIKYLNKDVNVVAEGYDHEIGDFLVTVYVDQHSVFDSTSFDLKKVLDTVVKRIDLVANNRPLDIYKEPFQWSLEHEHGSDENIIGKFTLNELGEYIESDYLLSSPEKNHHFVLRCLETNHWFGVEYVRGVCDALKECA